MLHVRWELKILECKFAFWGTQLSDLAACATSHVEMASHQSVDNRYKEQTSNQLSLCRIPHESTSSSFLPFLL